MVDDLRVEDWQDAARLQSMVDSFADPLFVKDRQRRFVAFNDAFCALLGRPRADLLGRSDPDFFPPAQVEVFRLADDAMFADGQPLEQEERLTTASGDVRTIWTRKYPLRIGAEIVALSGIISDITVLRRRLSAERDELIRRQTEMLDQMAAPVPRIWRDTLLVPLIGVMTPRRAALVLQGLLHNIATTRATQVLLDITGVHVLSADDAADLMRTVHASRLLGARVALVGIRPELARTLVALDLPFTDIATFATLEDGLRSVMSAPR